MLSSSLNNVRGLKIFGRKHKAVKTLVDKGSYPKIHGDKVWFSSYFIMDYLERKPVEKKSRVMEIGCGWGLLGVYCAKNFGAKVIGVDADKNVMPLLKLHARKNRVKLKTKVCRYENLKPKLLAKQDIILGGDICFWDELVDPLFSLIKQAMKQGVGTVIIADPGRTPFLALAKRCKKKYGAKLKPVSISLPTQESGYLLIVKNKKKS